MKKFVSIVLCALMLAGCSSSSASSKSSASSAASSTAEATASAEASSSAEAEETAAPEESAETVEAGSGEMVVLNAGMHVYDTQSFDGNVIMDTAVNQKFKVLSVIPTGATNWYQVQAEDGTEGYLFVSNPKTIQYNG